MTTFSRPVMALINSRLPYSRRSKSFFVARRFPLFQRFGHSHLRLSVGGIHASPKKRLSKPRALDDGKESLVREEKEEETDNLSEDYTTEMRDRMGDTSLVYCHEKGMNYARLTEDIIVGSCLQTSQDVDILVDYAGVTTILCLQEDVNLDYFSVDIGAIQKRCEERGDVRHIRCPIRDFDPMDLRLQLPKVVALICQQHFPSKNQTIYIHCTAGLGRAPAVALAYMLWCRDWTLDAANDRLQKVRPCGPKLMAIRQATCDLVYGANLFPLTLEVTANPNSDVLVAGLDMGWGQPVPMTYNSSTRKFELDRNLHPGRYSFKFIVDGTWTCSRDYPISTDGGNENNVVEVDYESNDGATLSALSRILSHDGKLAQQESWKLHAALKRLQPCNEECIVDSI